MNTDRLLILITLGMCIIALAGCAVPETCEELAPQIVELSEQDTRPFSATFLKLYDIEEIEGTRKLECTANAKLSSGGNSAIKFYLEEDADGDQFIGYQRR